MRLREEIGGRLADGLVEQGVDLVWSMRDYRMLSSSVSLTYKIIFIPYVCSIHILVRLDKLQGLQ